MLNKSSLTALALTTCFNAVNCSPDDTPPTQENSVTTANQGHFGYRIQRATQRAQDQGRDISEAQMAEIDRAQQHHAQYGGELPPCEEELMFFDGYQDWWEDRYPNQEVSDYICGTGIRRFCTAAFDINNGAYVVAWINERRDEQGKLISTLAVNGVALRTGAFDILVRAGEPELIAAKELVIQQWNPDTKTWDDVKVSYEHVPPNCSAMQ